MPAAKQKRSKLAETSSNALPTASIVGEAKTAACGLIVFMALLSFRGISTPSLPGSRRATPLLIFQQKLGHPPVNESVEGRPLRVALTECHALFGQFPLRVLVF